MKKKIIKTSVFCLLMMLCCNSVYAGEENNLANYAPVEQAMEQIPLDLSPYTEESIAVLNQAVNQVIDGLDASRQKDVNRWAQEITQATKALTLRPADYSGVESAFSKIPFDLSAYTAKSANAVTQAVNEIDYGLDVTEQSVVDGNKEQLQQAVASLEKKNDTESDEAALQKAAVVSGGNDLLWTLGLLLGAGLLLLFAVKTEKRS